MKAEILKSMYHLPNLLWLEITPSISSLKIIDSIVQQIDKGYPKKEGFIDWGNKTDYLQCVPLIQCHVPDLSKPHPKGCYAISIFLENESHFILMKQHPLFKEVEKKFFRVAKLKV